MLRTVLYAICTVLIVHRALCAGPPKVNKSYIAYGEITQPLKDLGNFELQAAFEESYDVDNENAAFVVWMLGTNVTFIKNFKTNQTFKYTARTECEETNEREWIQSEYPPALLAYEDDDGSIRFSLRQLFNLPDKYLVSNKQQGAPAVYRGVPAKLWIYEIPGRDKDANDVRRKIVVYAYWSDGTWTTSSNEDSVPLGYNVDKTQWSGKVNIDETVISVFGFVTDTYDRKLFEPAQGVICANRTQTLKFPDIQNIKAISMHSEMVLPDYQEIRYIDTWFDPLNQLVRIDVERLRDEDPVVERKTKRYESEIAIGKLGVVFRQSVFKDKFVCEVIPFSKYQNDVQNFIDMKNLTKWKMGKLFGLNDTTYVYTGKTVKSEIPCHVFQGIRNDWPEVSANVTSLWEWCFNVDMSKDDDVVLFLNDDEQGLINAQVEILSSGMPMDYPVGFRMFHHFYDVKKQDPAILDATRFDISRCFTDSNRIALQFYIDLKITDDNMATAENLTSDVTFLQRWKATIYRVSKLPDYSLRIAKVQSTIVDQKLYIKFVILSDQILPHEVWVEQISAYEAEENLKKDEGSLSINYVLNKGDKQPTTLKAVTGSIAPQINPNVEHHTLAPPTPIVPTSPTKFPFSLITEPDSVSKSTEGKSTEGKSTASKSTASKSTEGKSTEGKSTASKSSGSTVSGSSFTVTDSIVSGSTVSGSTVSDSTASKSSPGPTKPPIKKVVVKISGHQPGTVATVSIAMLLCGVTVGSAGTFYKFFGLPSCIR